MSNTLVYITLISLFWGGWPLVARAAGPITATGSALLCFAALLPVVILAIVQGQALPYVMSAGKLCVAGLMMGAGLICFNIVASGRTTDISIVVPVINTSMMLVTVLGGILFFAEPITTQKVFGISLLIAGIILLRPT